MMLPIAGIAVAVAVTAGAALAMQIRSDIGNAAAFEERENHLVETNRKNAELAERNAKAKTKADVTTQEAERRYRLALKGIDTVMSRANKAEARADAATAFIAEMEEPEPCECTWSSPLPPLR